MKELVAKRAVAEAEKEEDKADEFLGALTTMTRPQIVAYIQARADSTAGLVAILVRLAFAVRILVAEREEKDGTA